MARPPREDEPGADHHIWNRAIGRRTMFEFASETRRFAAGIAREVHAGEIRVHAFTFLSNHFHLVVESVKGNLSDCMRRIQCTYSRSFNLPRERTGTLVQGRFRSRRLEGLSDRLTLVCYIDRNPVEAGLARHGAFYPHGSAVHYARRKGPPWLERSWIESVVCATTGRRVYDPAAYPRVFGHGMPPERVAWMERRIRAGHRGPDPLDDLIRRAPESVREWMETQARLADGTPVGLPIVAAAVVIEVLRSAGAGRAPWSLRGVRRDAWEILTVGLLRDLAGETFGAIGVRLGLSPSVTRSAHQAHRELMSTSSEYAERTGRLAHDAIDRCHGWLKPLLPILAAA